MPRHGMGSIVLTSALIAGVSALPAFAHSDPWSTSGLFSGLVHPVSGWDHMAAIVAVGLWGALLGSPALWLLPVVFPLVMALGGAIGILGVRLPGVEIGIALSAIVLGSGVLLTWKPSLALAGVLVGLFAAFHGYAHGKELPAHADPMAYALGFVVSTGLLHVSGIVIGLLSRWPFGLLAVRAGGGLIAIAGVLFLMQRG